MRERKTAYWLTSLLLIVCFCASAQVKKENSNSIKSLRLIGEYDLPHNQQFKATTIGGLSGIDYDAEKNLYYLISDDRSAINAARYYTAKIYIGRNKIDSVVFKDVHTLLQKNGTVYPNTRQDPGHTPDPEALRYNPVKKNMVWSSEGERILRGKDTLLENPAITIISTDGRYIDTFPLPENLKMQAIESGPRQNGVLEGMSFANNYRTLYVNLEEPLYEDGPRAGNKPGNAFVRIYAYDVATKKNTAQYAYLLDTVAYPAIPASAFMVNGIPDILWLGNQKLIVLERSFSTGRLPCTIKLFLADLNGATDIRNNPSLIKWPAAKPVSKKLLLNMDELGIYVDNVEGICFGPTLPNGHRTLVLVADNNFVALEKTQFFVFEIIP
ncbi:MAG: hypothetical protein RLZZ28_2079 [Bacteroidota bacterium]